MYHRCAVVVSGTDGSSRIPMDHKITSLNTNSTPHPVSTSVAAVRAIRPPLPNSKKDRITFLPILGRVYRLVRGENNSNQSDALRNVVEHTTCLLTN
mmetsp:Transcript_32240/g.37310  ORF Transcript_32240/g.37310 Transcript_32240/m.37310 type:complete len:97 (+) Transcript_32240:782-1072(+)